MARKRTRYTDDFRASAVLLLEAAGYPDEKGALARVSRRVNVPHNTLSNWYRQKRNPVPAKLRREKSIDLVAAIKAEIAEIVGVLDNTRQDANYKELIVAFAVLIDKLQLLTGAPTERSEHEHLIRDATATERRILGRMDSIATRIGTVAVDRPHSTNGTG